VQGACLGAGLGLALGCDVVYVADDAKIGSPFARIGAVLDSGGHSFFVSRLGAHRALELIYTGRLLSGTEAAALGLVNQSMPRDVLLTHARKIAGQVAQGPTAAFMQSKRMVRRIDEEALGLFAVLKCEAQAQGAAGRTADYKEGITAFQQKRAPKFQGK
jgi:enoyl-CoA hydratase/carnithine racemase